MSERLSFLTLDCPVSLRGVPIGMRGDVSVQLEVNDSLLILVLRTNYGIDNDYGFNNIARSLIFLVTVQDIFCY